MFPVFAEAGIQECKLGSVMEENKLALLQHLLEKLGWFSPRGPESTFHENNDLPYSCKGSFLPKALTDLAIGEISNHSQGA